ncbi:MAG: hypothetical protein Q4G34_02480 [Micrococcus sp.]|nr:hypothetical protein [Micrococcus sp.]
MRPPRALPPSLGAAAFTSTELAAAGIPSDRVRARDVTRIAQGVYVPEGIDERSWSAAAALARTTGGVVSHLSAAQHHGIPVPARLQADTTLHLSFETRNRTHRSELTTVTSHRRRLPRDLVVDVNGLPVTTPARTWCDLASMLLPHEQPALVAAADHLITPPWTPQGRAKPLLTVGDLHSALRQSGQFKGIRLARSALELARMGADSVPETLMRLALMDAGLPEPELQLAIDPSDPRAPVGDAGYRVWLILLQYDGAGHRSPEQQARDAYRDGYAQQRGWVTVRATVTDLRDGFRRVIGLVRSRAASFGGEAIPHRPSSFPSTRT